MHKVCQKLSWGRTIAAIPSISDILSQMWYHCVQYTSHHLMSLISHCQHGFCQSWLIWACYLFLGWSAAVPVCQILMKWGQFFVRQDNIWQILSMYTAANVHPPLQAKCQPMHNHLPNVTMLLIHLSWMIIQRFISILTKLLIELLVLFNFFQIIWQTIPFHKSLISNGFSTYVWFDIRNCQIFTSYAFCNSSCLDLEQLLNTGAMWRVDI